MGRGVRNGCILSRYSEELADRTMWIQLVDENNRKVKNQNQIHVFGD